MKTRSILSTSIVGIILVSIIGTSLNSGESTHETKLRIAYFPNIGHVIPIVGIENGSFEKNIGNRVAITSGILTTN